LLALLLLLPLAWAPPTAAENPFLSGKAPKQVSPEPASQPTWLTKIALVQQQIKQKLSALIRRSRTEGQHQALLLAMLVAFGYGAVHAAGPGHGKVFAMSFMLSRNPSTASGLFFGTFVAFFHGMSGVLCVLGLRYVLQQSVSGNLADISQVTQIVSFSLIALIGLAILAKNARAFFKRPRVSFAPPKEEKSSASRAGLLPWALAVGLVPCPGVVMVMLFCLSMEALLLGIALSLSISAGMAATISAVVVAVVIGKAGVLKSASQRRTETIEAVFGMLSGTAVSALGIAFLLPYIGPA